MKTIVFINTNKSGSSREAIKVAERLGYYTILITDKIRYLTRRTEFPDVHLILISDLSDIDKMRNIIKQQISRGLDIKGILSFVDPYCSIACKLAQEFGVNRLSKDAIIKMESKKLSREAIKDSKHCPDFMTVPKDKKPSEMKVNTQLPIIMKCVNSTGSKDVVKINNNANFKYYIENLRTKYPNDDIIIEQYLDGAQYLIEIVVFDSKISIIAIIKQEIFYKERFIITGYQLMTNPSKSFLFKIKDAITSIIDDHGMTSGACHLEMRYVDKEWKLIEINPRISGAGMNIMIEISTGINLVEQTLKYSLGQSYNIKPKYKKPCFAQYVILDKSGKLKRVVGKNRAKKSKGVKAVYIKPRKGTWLKPPVSMGQRYAYVIATGKTDQEARLNAKAGADNIKFSLSEVSTKEKVGKYIEQMIKGEKAD